MKSKIHHISLAVKDFDWYVNFFQEVFAMTVERTQGEAPKRQLWFAEGVQINEVADDRQSPALAAVDHFSLGVDIDPVEAANIAKAHGCTEVAGKGPHWFALPNGVLGEMKPIR